jgi:hypothetical protein
MFQGENTLKGEGENTLKGEEIRTVYREYTLEEIKAMSNAKRRNLQDRGIIPKGTF